MDSFYILEIYEYDSFNRLTKVVNGGSISTYTYNGSGQRQSKTVNGITTNHIWDGSNIAAETDGSQAVTARYYRGAALIAQEKQGSTEYFQMNGRGDVTGLTDSSGENVKTFTYDAFGNQLGEEETSATPFRYNGEYYDEETGFTYLRARYYDPSMGRFITEDPIHDGINWYAYCGNNPVMFIDPSGYLNQGYDENGVWRDWDAEEFGEDSNTYKMLVALTLAYDEASYKNDGLTMNRIAQLAADLRVTDTTITDNILLNDVEGALTAGHNAILLLNRYGEGFLFSYANRDGAKFSGQGEYRFALLSVEEVARLKDGSGEVFEEVTIWGERHDEIYYRFVWNDLTPEQGEAIFSKAIDVFINPGKYTLAGHQCDNVAGEVLSAGDAGYDASASPNLSYELYSIGRISWPD